MLSLKVKILANKTIKELADELGVTKQTIQYHYKSLPTKYRQKSDKGIIQLTPESQRFLTNKINKFVDKETTKKHIDYTLEDQLISHLKGELSEVKKEYTEQLHVKDQQLATMQKLLDQQQQLTLQSNKRIDQLEAQLQIGSGTPEEKQPSAEEQQTDPDSVPDKKWWHFLKK